jgi:hypothetical protein
MSKTGKIVKYILWALLIVSAVLIISLIVNINEEVKTDPAMLGWVNTNLIWAYILVAVGAGVAVLAGIFNMIADKRAAKAGLVSIAFIAVVAIISYALASSEIPQFIGSDKFIADGTLTANVAKMVDASLKAVYILVGLAILAIASSPIIRLFR